MKKKKFIKNKPFDELDAQQMLDWIEEGILDNSKTLFSPGVVTGFQLTPKTGFKLNLSLGKAYTSDYRLIQIDTATEVTLDAANTSNRYDTVSLRYRTEISDNVDTTNKYGRGSSWVYSQNILDKYDVVIRKGTPSSTPSIPSVPSTEIHIANILVKANASAIASGDITDKRTMTQLIIKPDAAQFGLETPQGAQTKANTAETNAKNHANTKASEAEANAIQAMRDYGLGGVAKSVTDMDLNNVTETGFYQGYRYTNGAVANTISVFIVIKYSKDWITQIQIPVSASQQIFSRNFTSGTTWSSWIQQETINGAQARVDNHANNKSNPHSVTKSQVGLGNVDNVQQATKSEFNSHTGDKNNPHNVTKSQVGLGNVDNIQQATKNEFLQHTSNRNNPHNVTSEQINVIPVKSVNQSPETYPNGISVFTVASSDGYPRQIGIVVTNKISGARTSQTFYEKEGEVHYRTGATDGSTWSSWEQFETVSNSNFKINATQKFKLTRDDGTTHGYYDGDLNALKTPGGYIAYTQACTNKPSNAIGVVFLLARNSSTHMTQIAWAMGGLVVNMYMRHSNDSGSTWSDWEQQETTIGAQNKANSALNSAKDYAVNMVSSGSTADPNTTQEAYILTNHTNAPPGSNYYHIQTLFYSNKTGNRSQIATSYNNAVASIKMYFRQFFNGTWSPWKEVETVDSSDSKLSTHANNKNNPHGVTAAQVGAVPTNRFVSGGSGITGGGTLSVDRSFSIDTDWMNARYATLRGTNTFVDSPFIFRGNSDAIEFRPPASGGTTNLGIYNNGDIISEGTFSVKNINRVNRIDFSRANAVFYDDYGNPNANTESGYWTVIDWTGEKIIKLPFKANDNVEFLRNIDFQNGKGTITAPDIIRLQNRKYNTNFQLSGDATSSFLLSMDVYNRTYTYNANVYVTGNGVIGRSTSARKYKIQEKEVDNSIAENILKVVPKTWFDKTAAEQYANAIAEGKDFDKEDIPYVERIPGIVAEDVEDAGLPLYVNYGNPDKDGNREIEGVMYDRLWTLLIPLVKEDRENIKKLKSKNELLEKENEELKNRLNSIEDRLKKAGF